LVARDQAIDEGKGSGASVVAEQVRYATTMIGAIARNGAVSDCKVAVIRHTTVPVARDGTVLDGEGTTIKQAATCITRNGTPFDRESAVIRSPAKRIT